MKRSFFLFFTFLCITKVHATGRPLVHELSRLKINTVLFWSGEKGLDDWPLWSPDGKWVAVNEAGRGWIKISLENVLLTKSQWLNQSIGRNHVETCDSLLPRELESSRSNTKYDPRKIITADGIKIELALEGFSVALKVNDKIQWRTNGDNCHSLSLSADEKYVAFFSEANGLMIFDFKNSYKKEKLLPEVVAMNNALNFFSAGKPDKAETALNKALTINSAYAVAWEYKGFLFYGKADTAAALACLDSAILKDPSDFNFLYTKSQILSDAKKYQEALECIGKYIEMRPACLFGYYTRAEIFEKMGKKEEACKDYEFAKRFHSGRAKKKLKSYCN